MTTGEDNLSSYSLLCGPREDVVHDAGMPSQPVCATAHSSQRGAHGGLCSQPPCPVCHAGSGRRSIPTKSIFYHVTPLNSPNSLGQGVGDTQWPQRRAGGCRRLRYTSVSESLLGFSQGAFLHRRRVYGGGRRLTGRCGRRQCGVRPLTSSCKICHADVRTSVPLADGALQGNSRARPGAW